MKKHLFAKLFFLLIFFFSEKSFCQVQIDSLFQTADSSFKNSIVTIVTPQLKHVHIPGSHGGYDKYYSEIKFDIDINGKQISFQTEHYDVDGNIEGELYFSSKPDFKYVVKYNQSNPAQCEVMIYQPVIASDEKIDTAIAEIKWMFELTGAIEYFYRVPKVDTAFSNEECVQEKGSLYFDRPNVIRGNKFLVKYCISNPQRSIILLDRPIVDSSYIARPGKNVIEFWLSPIYKMRIGYGRILNNYFTAGINFSYYYQHFKNDSSTFMTDGQFLSIGNSFRVDPFLKWYPIKMKTWSWYLKIFASCAYIQQADFNYFSVDGLPSSTSITSFFQQYPNGAALIETKKPFFAKGYGGGIGLSFFLGNKYKFILEFGAGYQQLFIPPKFRKDDILNNTNFYFTNAPAITDIILYQNIFLDLNLIYRF